MSQIPLAGRRALLLAAVLAGCGGGPSSSNTPAEMAAHVAPEALAPGAAVEGCGDTWQGYSLFLRWRARPDADSLRARGWTTVPWDDVASDFALPDDYDCFEPAWVPDAVSPKEVYEGRFPNDWGQGEHRLLVDRAHGLVYFYGLAP